MFLLLKNHLKSLKHSMPLEFKSFWRQEGTFLNSVYTDFGFSYKAKFAVFELCDTDILQHKPLALFLYPRSFEDFPRLEKPYHLEFHISESEPQPGGFVEMQHAFFLKCGEVDFVVLGMIRSYLGVAMSAELLKRETYNLLKHLNLAEHSAGVLILKGESE